MKLRIIHFLFVVTTLLSSGTTIASAPEWPTCTTGGLTEGVIGSRTVDGVNYYVRRMATILDAAVTDFGANGLDMAVEIFCVSRKSGDTYGKIVMCLSGETCPWR